MTEPNMKNASEVLAPFHRVMGRFSFVGNPSFVEKQDQVYMAFESSLVDMVSDKKIRKPRLDIKHRAKEPDWTLVVDIRNEPLLFNITPNDIAFLLEKSDDLSLPSNYMEALVRAVERVLGPRRFISFDINATQIVTLHSVKNLNLMERLLPGLTEGRGLFDKVPRTQETPSYQVQRVDAKWTVLVGDQLEYIYDIEAPANDAWTKLWFTFTVRSPEETIANEEHVRNVADTIEKVLEGQSLLKELCGAEIDLGASRSALGE